MPSIKTSAAALYRFGRGHYESIVAMGIRGLSVLAGFMVSFLIGRSMGPAANGEYALITQTGMFLSIVAVGGIDLAVSRKFSETVAFNKPLNRKSLIQATAISLGFATILFCLLMLGGHPAMMLLFKGVIPNSAITLLILIMISRALTRLLGAVLRSQRSYIWSQSLEALLIPTVVALIILSGLTQTVNQILWATAIVGLTCGVTAFFSCLRYTSTDKGALTVPMRDLMRIAAPLWGVAVFLNISDWFSLAASSALLGVYQTGLYRVAVQIGTISSFLTMGLFNVFTPQIGAAHAKGDYDEIGRLSNSAMRLAALFVVPFTVVIFIFARPLLGIFGPEFTSATDALRILVAGQALFSITGHAGIVLAMTGHERANLAQTFIGTVALFVAAPIGAHFGGLEGLSLAVALVLVGRNIFAFFSVRALLGINVVTGHVRYRTEPA